LPATETRELFQPYMAVDPVDGDDKMIYSKKLSVSPYSFVDET